MKIAQINMIHYGSTGKIMLQIAEMARLQGHEVKTFSTIPYNKGKRLEMPQIKDHTVFGSYNENRMHYYFGSIFGTNGLHSHRGTKQLIRQLKSFNPDVVHLHNLHKFCINLPMLFRYLKESNVKVVWTMHDCWAFTGHCPHFTIARCDRWQTGCYSCPQPRVYPKMYLDTSRIMYQLKRRWFCGIKNMTLVTPSKWLADMVKQSYLRDYSVKVINNGIDLGVFKPIESDFKKNYNIPNSKKILLGVSFGWGSRKGLDVFVELAKRLDNKKYQIVLVGTDDMITKQLPETIISIQRINNQQELAEIYSAADLFINPTREEVLGLVNIEANACGTPVITFSTGGSPECIDETSGVVVACDDIDSMEDEIIRVCNSGDYKPEGCIKKAEKFDKSEKYKEYIKLYEDCAYSAESAL